MKQFVLIFERILIMSNTAGIMSLKSDAPTQCPKHEVLLRYWHGLLSPRQWPSVCWRQEIASDMNGTTINDSRCCRSGICKLASGVDSNNVVQPPAWWTNHDATKVLLTTRLSARPWRLSWSYSR